MRALLWKEMREVGLWASLLGLGLCAAEGFALFAMWRQYFPPGGSAPSDPTAMIDALYGNYKLWMSIGTPVAGFAIGMLQILPEQRREQWAFLIHRPVSLSQLFWAKAIAGILAYTGATLIPLALFTGWLLMPGHFPGPFSAVLALPDIASILVGTAFYFAGLTVALRPARWWGSRLLPLVAAVAGVLLMSVAADFGWAMLEALAAAALLLAAARGSFVTSGQYDPRSLAQRIGVGSSLMVGSATVVIGVAAIVYSVVEIRTYRTYPVWPFAVTAVTASGEFVQEIVENGGANRFLDGSGAPVRLSAAQAKRVQAGSDGLSFTLEYGGDEPYWSYERWYTVLASASVTAKDTYFLDDGLGVISVFSGNGSKLLGYIGRGGGLTSSTSGAAPFRGALLGSAAEFHEPRNVLLPFPGALYRLDTMNDMSSVFARPPTGTRFRAAQTFWLYGIGDDSTQVVAVSGGQAFVYGRDGRLLARFSATQGGISYDWVQVFIQRKPTRVYAVLQHYFDNYGAEGRPLRALFGEATGSDALTGTSLVRVIAGQRQPRRPQSPAVYGLEGSAATPAGCLAVLTAGAVDAPTGWRMGIESEMHDTESAWMLLGSIIGGLVSAVIAMLVLARVYGWRPGETAKWATAMFLLSWTGLLMVLAMIPFPPTATCGSCGKRRRMDRESCEHCGAAQPLPARDGTEIFEPLPVSAESREPAAAELPGRRA